MAFGSTRESPLPSPSTMRTSLCERGGEGASQGWNSLVIPAWAKHPTSFTRESFGEEPWEFRLATPCKWLEPSDAEKNNLSWMECSELKAVFRDSDSERSNSEYNTRDEQLLPRFIQRVLKSPSRLYLTAAS